MALLQLPTALSTRASEAPRLLTSPPPMDLSIFKACDVRGLYGTQLDEAAAYAVGRAAGSEIEGEDVVLGGDVRISTESIKAAVARGLTECGCNVTDIGVVPTPVAYFAKRHLGSNSVVIVTASHNPPAYNGIKMMLRGAPTVPATIDRLITRITDRSYIDGHGSVRQTCVKSAYRDWLIGAFDGAFDRSLRILVDAGNGCYAEWAPEILSALGHDVVPLHCVADGTFPDRDPNPAVHANLTATSQAIRECGADLGLAFDGDGDRIVVLDEDGQPTEADRIAVFFVRHLLDDLDAPSVVYDLKCSDILRHEIEAVGGTAYMERSGHSFIRSRMMSCDAVFGAEISGHLFFRGLDYGDDGLYAGLLAARILSGSDKSLGAMIAEIPKPVITKDIRVALPDAVRKTMVKRFESAFPALPCTHIDGARIEWPNGWALCRGSVTEPVVTLRCEAQDTVRLCEILQTIADAIPELHDALLTERHLLR